MINRSDLLNFPYNRELAMAGAHVTLACRNTKSAGEIVRTWQREAQDSRDVLVEVSCALETHASTSISSMRMTRGIRRRWWAWISSLCLRSDASRKSGNDAGSPCTCWSTTRACFWWEVGLARASENSRWLQMGGPHQVSLTQNHTLDGPQLKCVGGVPHRTSQGEAHGLAT